MIHFEPFKDKLLQICGDFFLKGPDASLPTEADAETIGVFITKTSHANLTMRQFHPGLPNL